MSSWEVANGLSQPVMESSWLRRVAHEAGLSEEIKTSRSYVRQSECDEMQTLAPWVPLTRENDRAAADLAGLDNWRTGQFCGDERRWATRSMRDSRPFGRY